jgi:membrane protein DedA with SNARE-associated domain
MSLKAFHVVFVTSAVLLSLFMCGWFIHEYFTHDQHAMDLLFGILSAAGAVALLIYGRYFLRKLKNIDYF